MKNRWNSIAFLLLGSVHIFGFSMAVAVRSDASEYRPQILKIESTILDEPRTLTVSLPENYEAEPDVRYPLLVFLDAESQDSFNRAEEAVKELRNEKLCPLLILIGVWNTNRNRDMIPEAVAHRPESGGSDLFLRFLFEELKPYLATKYRTLDFSILYGASNAGLFTVYALMQNPAAFDAYIASSPMIGHCPVFMQNRLESFVKENRGGGRTLYIIFGREDSQRVTEYVPNFMAFLKEKAVAEFRVGLDILEEVGHVPPSSLERGLRFVFGPQKRENREE